MSIRFEKGNHRREGKCTVGFGGVVISPELCVGRQGILKSALIISARQLDKLRSTSPRTRSDAVGASGVVGPGSTCGRNRREVESMDGAG